MAECPSRPVAVPSDLPEDAQLREARLGHLQRLGGQAQRGLRGGREAADARAAADTLGAARRARHALASAVDAGEQGLAVALR